MEKPALQKDYGYTVYYETIPDLDWKLGIAIENSELNAPVISLGIKLAIIAAVILIIMILVILSQVKSVSDRLIELRTLLYSWQRVTLKYSRLRTDAVMNWEQWDSL